MVFVPVPDRVVLNGVANNRRQVMRDFARWIAEDLHLHPVGIQEFLGDGQSAAFESQVYPGLIFLDGCLPGIDHHYFSILRLARPILWGGEVRVPIHTIICFLSNDTDHSGHVHGMSQVVRFLKETAAVNAIAGAERPDEITALFMGVASGRIAA